MVEQKEEDSQASEYLGADMGEEDSISRRAERGSPVILRYLMVPSAIIHLGLRLILVWAS